MISLAARDVLHTWGKFVFTGVGLGLLIGVTLTMAGVYRGMVDDAKVLLNNSGADLWVVQKETLGPYAEPSSVHDDVYRSILGMPGVARAANVTYLTMQVRQGDRDVRQITRSHYEAVADVATGFKLGQVLRIRRHNYTVVGLTRRMVSSGGDPMVFNPFVNAILVQIKPGFTPEKVAEPIRRWKRLQVYTRAQMEEILVAKLIATSSKQIGMFLVILAIVSAAIIAFIIYTLTMGKIREIAVLKLIGTRNRTIAGMIMQQAIGLGLIGFVVGKISATIWAPMFPKYVLLEPEDALRGFIA